MSRELHSESEGPGLKAPFMTLQGWSLFELLTSIHTPQRSTFSPAPPFGSAAKTEEPNPKGRTAFPCGTEAHAHPMKNNASFCPAAPSGSAGWNLMPEPEAARWMERCRRAWSPSLAFATMLARSKGKQRTHSQKGFGFIATSHSR